MSEATQSGFGTPTGLASAVDSGHAGLSSEQTAGTLLRNAREAAGMHIAALAVALKVPVKKIEALEADRFDLLPDTTFVRALASSVCRTLKIDAAPVLAKLPSSNSPNLARPEIAQATPFVVASGSPGWREQLTRPAVVFAAVLILGAAALKFGTSWLSRSHTEPVASQTEAEGSTNSSGKDANKLSTDATEAAPAQVEAPTQPASTAAPAGTPTLAVTEPAGTETGIVSFTASGTSWIKVTDAHKQVTFQRALAAGETASASGTPPLNVVVGRADLVQVQVRGQPMDLKPIAHGNVARFEVK